MSQILIASDYERKGSVYCYDRVTGKWYGHHTSISRWVHYVRAPICLEVELQRKAINMGYCPSLFAPKPKFSDLKKKKKKVSKVSKENSSTFIPLFK